MKRIWVVLAALLAVGGAGAQENGALDAAEAQALFAEANEATLDGRTEAALARYRRLVEAGYGTADVWYNLGNAALEQARLGEAVLGYQRALRLDPRHADARTNLEAARRRSVDRLVGVGSGPDFFERVARALPVAPVAWGFAAAWGVAFLGATALRLLSKGRRLAGVAAVAGLGAAVVLGGLLALSVWYRERVPEGVVMDATLPVRRGPAERFEAEFEIHEGLTVRLLERESGFVRVRLANGLEGWVRGSGLERI